jgi:hypothetical protein
MTPQIENTIAQLTAEGNIVTDAQTLYTVGRQNGMTCKEVKETFIQDALRVSRGQYNIALLGVEVAADDATSDSPVVNSETEGVAAPPVSARPSSMPVMNQQKIFADVEEVYVPAIDTTFVPWGDYRMVRQVIDSKLFFPTYISGLSGNGKTMMVEQACARAKREFVRVQISPETDETDLIGGFRLIDGETVFYKGPVVKAMERGAVLLIDEIDRGSNKIMCLQGVLEGKPVLIKKIGQVIVPARGFTIFATANTKGRGSEDGRFSSANIIDEAFLERFVATVDQPYPNAQIEKNIVLKHMTQYGVKDIEFADKLVAWSQVIRKTYEDDGVEEVVSTRRLCHIIKAHSIFKDRAQSIARCIARFDPDTRAAFSELYSKIDLSPPVPDHLLDGAVAGGFVGAGPYDDDGDFPF